MMLFFATSSDAGTSHIAAAASSRRSPRFRAGHLQIVALSRTDPLELVSSRRYTPVKFLAEAGSPPPSRIVGFPPPGTCNVHSGARSTTLRWGEA